MVYETVTDWEYQQKCSTQYEKKCHGYGYHQECESVPKEICKQVPKKVERQVPRTKCKSVPDKKCQDVPINVPRKECREFPKTVCTEDPIQVTPFRVHCFNVAFQVKKKIPKKICKAIPIEKCIKIPRQIISEVPKTVGKKLCTSTKPSSYHEPSYHAPAPSYHAPEPSYHAPAPSYHAPAPSYHAPAPSYHAPAPSYHAPKPSYGYGKVDDVEGITHVQEESEDTGNLDLSYGAPEAQYSSRQPSYSEVQFQYGSTVQSTESPYVAVPPTSGPQYGLSPDYSPPNPYAPLRDKTNNGIAGIAPSDQAIADHWDLGPGR